MGQELVHPSLAKMAGAPALLSDGRSPSILNGGLVAGPVPAFLLATAAAIGYLDVQAEAKKAEYPAEDWIPGYYGFDPLNIVGGMSPLAIKNMQARFGGRNTLYAVDAPARRLPRAGQGNKQWKLAMVAVVAYVVQEAMTGEPVTSVSEQFFTPIIYYPWVQHLLTDAFGIASFRS